MSQYLEQTRRESRGQYKYSVDCEKIKKDPTTLQVLDGDVRAKHTMVINAVVKESKIPLLGNKVPLNESNGKVVVKIGKTNDSVRQEYNIAKRLESLDGFIKMNCLFSCYNTTNLTNKNTRINPSTFEICKSSTEENNVDVLIMPYIHNGETLHSFLKTKRDPEIYKSILKQVITNLYNAYTNTGFIHKDLHFGNILIDENNKPIIMDFDTSDFNGEPPFCLADLQRLFISVLDQGSILNNISYSISTILTIQTILNTALLYNTSRETLKTHIDNILNMIDISTISVNDNTNKPTSYVYDPNVYGGKNGSATQHCKTRKSRKYNSITL